MRVLLLAATALLLISLAGPGQADARKATRSERIEMLRGFRAGNEAVRNEPRRCWGAGFVTRVSRLRPRTGVILPSARRPSGCVQGNGSIIMRRRTPKSTRWRIAWQGSGEIPCRYITSRMARELKLGRRCGTIFF